MYLNDFSVRVPEGTEKPGGYIEMDHAQQYSILLRNNNNVRCDAEVSIDGNMIGVFRIEKFSNLLLERPPHDTGKFTFYKAGTSDSYMAGLGSVPSDKLGLIRVEFKPEKKQQYTQYVNIWDIVPKSPEATYTNTSDANYRTMSETNSAGGTGLSGNSNQKFSNVNAIQYDFDHITTIHLRLVCRNNSNEPRPLMQNATPIPPAISNF